MAAVLSFLMPGLGQLIQGRVLHAVGFFLLTILGYALFIIPGLILHIFCVMDAAKYDRLQAMRDAATMAATVASSVSAATQAANKKE